MADFLDLYNTDYDNFINHCKECPGTFAIKVFINNKIKKYKNDNDDMIVGIMERIERHYTEIVVDLDDYKLFYPLEVLNFKKDYNGINEPEVRYLYCYLWFLLDNPMEVNKIIGVQEKGLHVASDKSFNTGHDKKSLSDLFAHLVEYGFLEKRSESEFLKIFSNELLTDIQAIRWLGEYRKGADMQTLFEMIKHLCSWEYTEVGELRFFFNKINDCFKKYNGEEIGFTNIRTNYSRWKKDDLTSKILKTPDFRNKKFLLIKYLQEFPSK